MATVAAVFAGMVVGIAIVAVMMAASMQGVHERIAMLDETYEDGSSWS